MRIRVSREWQVAALPEAKLQLGQVFDVPSRLALYLGALHCIERLPPTSSGHAADVNRNWNGPFRSETDARPIDDE
jgi:hypothetical protein